jgi:hypothetical protein
MDAYPEAYDEFKHIMAMLVLHGQNPGALVAFQGHQDFTDTARQDLAHTIFHTLASITGEPVSASMFQFVFHTAQAHSHTIIVLRVLYSLNAFQEWPQLVLLASCRCVVAVITCSMTRPGAHTSIVQDRCTFSCRWL